MDVQMLDTPFSSASLIQHSKFSIRHCPVARHTPFTESSKAAENTSQRAERASRAVYCCEASENRQYVANQ